MIFMSKVVERLMMKQLVKNEEVHCAKFSNFDCFCNQNL